MWNVRQLWMVVLFCFFCLFFSALYFVITARHLVHGRKLFKAGDNFTTELPIRWYQVDTHGDINLIEIPYHVYIFNQFSFFFHPRQTHRYYIFVFIAAKLLIGAGTAPLFTLGTSYLDENVKPKVAPVYLGIWYACTSFGPGIGFVAGGTLLNVYVDLIQVCIDVENNFIKFSVNFRIYVKNGKLHLLYLFKIIYLNTIMIKLYSGL